MLKTMHRVNEKENAEDDQVFLMDIEDFVQFCSFGFWIFPLGFSGFANFGSGLRALVPPQSPPHKTVC